MMCDAYPRLTGASRPARGLAHRSSHRRHHRRAHPEDVPSKASVAPSLALPKRSLHDGVPVHTAREVMRDGAACGSPRSARERAR